MMVAAESISLSCIFCMDVADIAGINKNFFGNG